MTEKTSQPSSPELQHSDEAASGDAVTRRGFLGTAATALAASSVVNPGEASAAEPPKPFLLGHPDRASYQPGDTLALHISTDAEFYDLTIARCGLERQVVWSRKGIKGRKHPIPEDASANGCRWPVALDLKIPADWPSGYYEATTPSAASSIYFVVRSAASGPHAKILLQLSNNTDNAYNNWGGYSLYAYNGRDGVQGRRASFHRPTGGMVRRWEMPFIQWAEAQGYELDYAVNNDLEFHPEILERYKLVLSVGHDEYWTAGMRDNLEAFISRGGNVAFFSGNVACWQVRNENDGLGCYKEYFEEDPLYRQEGPNPKLSTLWSHYLIDRPENEMTGVGVLHGGFHRSHNQYMDGSGAFTVHRPKHWIFEGTDLTSASQFGGERTIVGYECDGCQFETKDGLPVPTGRDGTPRDFEILATAPAKWGPEETILWYERWPEDQQGHACLGLYTKPGGGTVFTAGTTDWSHGLSGNSLPAVDRVTRNLLDRLS